MPRKKIDPKFKKKWLNALRSGKYKQTNHRLRTDNKAKEPAFCCLGVACDVYDNTRWESLGTIYRWEGQADHAFVPQKLADSLGLTKANQNYLSLLNDNKHLDFAHIANWIEREL